MTEDRPAASPSTPPRRSTYQAPADEDAIDEETIVSVRGARATTSNRSSARDFDGADDNEVDETTALARRRSAPADDATSVSMRRAAPVDDVTRLSRRRGPASGDPAYPAESGEPARPAESADPAGPDSDEGERAPGPRRSGATTPSAPGQVAAAPADDAEIAGDTVLRPSRRAAPATSEPRRLDEESVAGSRRAAYVPTAVHTSDRRAPRRADAPVVPRRPEPSPRSLDRALPDASGHTSRRARRGHARSRLLLLAGGVLLVATSGAVALVLLLI